MVKLRRDACKAAIGPTGLCNDGASNFDTDDLLKFGPAMVGIAPVQLIPALCAAPFDREKQETARPYGPRHTMQQLWKGTARDMVQGPPSPNPVIGVTKLELIKRDHVNGDIVFVLCLSGEP